MVAISYLAFLPTQAADELIMGQRGSVAVRLSNMLDQSSLTLCWRSFLGGGSDIVAAIVSPKGGENIDYSLILSHNSLVFQNARRRIVDAPLMLIVKRY